MSSPNPKGSSDSDENSSSDVAPPRERQAAHHAPLVLLPPPQARPTDAAPVTWALPPHPPPPPQARPMDTAPVMWAPSLPPADGIAVGGGAGGGSSRSVDISGTRPLKRKVSDEEVPEGTRYICAVCERSFKSPKALSGHMRSHPDREWRGCYPPPLADFEARPLPQGAPTAPPPPTPPPPPPPSSPQTEPPQNRSGLGRDARLSIDLNLPDPTTETADSDDDDDDASNDFDLNETPTD